MEDVSANSILAFCIINFNTPLPFEYARNMNLADPLYLSLHVALRHKRKMEDERIGRICAVIASVNGKQKFSSEDFMLREQRSQADLDAESQANFDTYASLQERGLIK